MSPEETSRFIDALKEKEGCFYCWPTAENNYSGKGLDYAKYKDVYDCSGLITACLYEATNGRIDHRADWNAGHLMQHCQVIDEKDRKPGDLIFYGLDNVPEHISHVMAVVSYPKAYSWRVAYGASGGGHKTVTPEIAQAQDARVRWFSSIHYRPDFIAVGRLFV